MHRRSAKEYYGETLGLGQIFRQTIHIPSSFTPHFIRLLVGASYPEQVRLGHLTTVYGLSDYRPYVCAMEAITGLKRKSELPAAYVPAKKTRFGDDDDQSNGNEGNNCEAPSVQFLT